MSNDNVETMRKTVKLKRPNPLFEKWLTEWLEDAKNKNLEKKVMFRKALQSLKKYPLPLKSGKECLILENFGPYISEKLDKKLAEYTATQATCTRLCVTVEDNNEPKNKKPKETKKTHTKEDLNGRKKHTKEYIPTWRSAAYAFLVTLYNKLSEVGTPGEMSKAELLTCAQRFCDTSLTKPDIILGSAHYTGWNSMSTLVKKNLVHRRGHPPKFSLTEHGIVLAEKLPTFELNCVEVSPQAKCAAVCETNTVNTQEATHNTMEQVKAAAANVWSEYIMKALSGGTNVKASSSMAKTSGNSPKKFHSELASEQPSANDNVKVNVNSDDQTVQSSDSSQQSLYSETISFAPGSFRIILLIDVGEPLSAKRAIDFLVKCGVQSEVRKLSVGDYIWICRNSKGEELVLPYVIERKRLDDFSGSISDGRFHEQKFRLKRCGLEQCIYLIEKYTHHGLPLGTLQQAAVNTQLHDKFFVKFTDSMRDSLYYLNTLTQTLIRQYSQRHLISSDRSILPKDNSSVELMTFKNFKENSVKNRNFTVSEMFLRHLMQLHSLSVAKASAILEKYPTPHSLMEAYRNGGDENLLTSVTVGKSERKIGTSISKALHELYTSTNLK